MKKKWVYKTSRKKCIEIKNRLITKYSSIMDVPVGPVPPVAPVPPVPPVPPVAPVSPKDINISNV